MIPGRPTNRPRSIPAAIAGGLLALLAACPAAAEEKAANVDLARWLTGLDPAGVEVPIRAFFLITVLSVVPSIVLLATCYPRILIILSFLRRALGAPDLPSNQILAGLTLLLTVLIMMPVWRRVHAEAYVPLSNGELKTTEEAITRASIPIKDFMLEHTYEKDLKLFVELSRSGDSVHESAGGAPPPAKTLRDLGFFVVFPAFVLSELKLAFQMGFLLCLPFLVIDLAVSAVLLSMGMFLLPPALVSLPLKVLVFVLADGWNLVVAQVFEGFRSIN